MRKIPFDSISRSVTKLCKDAAFDLPSDVLDKMRAARDAEPVASAKTILDQYLMNADIASKEQLAICQDTGFAVYLVELGDDVYIEGGSLVAAISEGTARGYKEGYLRNSIVSDPVFDRKNTGDNTPPVVHVEHVSGDKLRITLAPKGGGSENMSAIAMLKPSDGEDGIVQFVTRTVTAAGGNPCPPTIVGVGIGGTFEKCAYLAKKALFRKTGQANQDKRYAELEQRILESVNKSGVGPQGLGGKATALAVHIETYPCHIASMPVAVNLNCHAARHASVDL